MNRVRDAAVPRFDPARTDALTFEPVRKGVVATFSLEVEAGRAGDTTPGVSNAANEIGVEALLHGRILFFRRYRL